MKIGSFMPLRSVWDDRIAALSREFPQHEFHQGLRPGDSVIPSLDLILGGNLPDKAAYLEPAGLKAIFQPFTGINHLPLEALSARKVRVFNVHANAFDVAERALAMTLAFYGRIIEFHNDLAKAVWHGYWVHSGAEDNWDSLRGRKCAILGTGAIGVELAKLLKAFSCPVVGWRRRPAAPVPEGFDAVSGDLDEVLAGGEVIFIALPATPLTQGILTRDRLMSMKGKLLVNVGRGSIVDEEGLYLALRDGVLAGAAIDTWYEYPKSGKVGAPSRFPIHTLPNVILSPHSGGSTNQASAWAVDITIDNLRTYLATGDCSPEADLKAMY